MASKTSSVDGDTTTGGLIILNGSDSQGYLAVQDAIYTNTIRENTSGSGITIVDNAMITDATVSTTPSTGALVITGGLGVGESINVTGSVTASSNLLKGSSSGVISILPQAAAGTYNFNLPITAGTSGQVLTSAGGGGSPMTWTTLGGGSGTVTSVAASVPSFLSITGSPITSAGTLAIGLSGTALPVANGGTGVTSSTGTGNTVLSNTPTLVTPVLGAATGTSLTVSGAGTALSVTNDGVISGKLGVGTSTLNSILSVSNSSTGYTYPTASILRTLGSSSPSATQFGYQLSVGTNGNQSRLNLGVLDSGVTCIQAHEEGIGYKDILIQPNGGSVAVGFDGTPSTKLHINGDFYTVSNDTKDTVYIQNTGGGGNTKTALTVKYNAVSNDRAIARFENNDGSVMHISSGGYIGMGTTSPGYPLEITRQGPLTSWSGYLWYNNSGGNPATSGGDYVNVSTDNGCFRVNGSGGFLKVSDIRIKQNVRELSSSLELLNQLEPCVFDYIDPSLRKDIPGFIAQKVQQLFPELVNTGETGFLPNIMHVAAVEHGVIKMNIINYATIGDTIKLVTESNYEVITEITGIDNESFTVKDPTPEKSVFVYGVQVYDMLSLRQDSFNPYIIKAIQELTTRIKYLESKTCTC